MEDTLSRAWWTYTERGIIALGFGVVSLVFPRMSLAVLMILFAAYALDEGVFALVGAVRAGRQQQRWWPLALEGVFGIATGLVVIFAPVAAASALFVVLAIWALATGVLELIAAQRLRHEIKGEWLLALSGLLRLAFGALLLARQGQGVVALVGLTALYAILYSVVVISLSLRLKRHHDRLEDELGRRAPRGWTPQPV